MDCTEPVDGTDRQMATRISVSPVRGGDLQADDKVLGVLGTFVLDRVRGLGDAQGSDGPTGTAERSAGTADGGARPGDGSGEPETLGGIAYTLASAVVSVAPGWRVLPIARVGVDAMPRIRRWLDVVGLPSTGLVECPEANNRVTLRYDDDGRRTERLRGGVGAWSWDALAPRVARCDALLVNYISGHELDLETTRRLRTSFRGPVYADLHSLFLDTEDDGTRVPRALPDWRSWMTCFDAVQMNEDEMDLLRGSVEVEATVRFALVVGLSLVVCTRGADGAVCWASSDVGAFAPDVRADPAPGVATTSVGDETVVRYEIPAEPVDDADPTGCGDVFGGALCPRLLAGDGVERAARWAAGLAAIAARCRGAEGLVEEFRKRMETT